MPAVFCSVVSLVFFFCLIGCSQEQGREKQNEAQESLPEPEPSKLALLDAELAGMKLLMDEKKDSLPYEYADTFKLRLIEALQDSATLSCPFDSLTAMGVRIVESDDKNARIYYWLHPHTGSFRHFPAVVQYRDRSGGYHVQDLDSDNEDNAYAATAYFSLHHLADSTYLTIGGGQIWQGAIFEVIAPMVLSDSVLTASDLSFHFGDSTYTSIRLDKNWYFDNMEQFGNTVPLISTYDSASRVLTFPAIVDIETGEIYNNVVAEKSIRPSGDTVRLRFNGRFFEEI